MVEGYLMFMMGDLGSELRRWVYVGCTRRTDVSEIGEGCL